MKKVKRKIAKKKETKKKVRSKKPPKKKVENKKALKKKTAKRKAVREKAEKIPAGFELIAVHRYAGIVTYMDWITDGTKIALSERDGRTKVIDNMGNVVRRSDIRAMKGKGDFGGAIAFAPKGQVLARSYNGWIYFVSTDGAMRKKQVMPKSIHSLAWSPDGTRIACGGRGREVNLYLVAPFKLIWSVGDERSKGSIWDVAWSPDGRTIAVGHENGVDILDAETGRRLYVIERLSGTIGGICFSFDGKLLITKSPDNKVRVLRCDSWDVVAVMDEGGSISPGGIASHPKEPLLATRNDFSREIRIWRLDYGLILRGEPAVKTLKYQNAKAVLLGDTGVGKTGLAFVLTGKDFKATESTHGRHVWTLEKFRDDGVEKEVILWDMAGQPGYRLVHQLHLQEVSLALVLVDSRSETEPMRGVEYWARVLRQERSTIPLKRFLVEARIDVGRLAMSRTELAGFAKRHGFDSMFATSAKEGMGIDELRKAMLETVDWNYLPVISSDRLFKTIKEWLTEKKKKVRTRYIYTVDELYTLFHRKHYRREDVRSEFESCLRGLAAAGMVEVLEFSTLKEQTRGGDKVLLKAEAIDAYASVIIESARQEPTEIGHLREADVLLGKGTDGKLLPIPRGDRLNKKEEEQLVLLAAVEMFLKNEIALREEVNGDKYLVFPSQYMRASPFPGTKSYGIAYDFEGAVKNIFTTLVVRLAHAKEFKSEEFFRDAATFTAGENGVCIVKLDENTGEGRGRLTVFFEGNVNNKMKKRFLQYVFTHIRRRAVEDTVVRRRAYHCPKCKYLMDEQVVEKRLKGGKADIVCPNCDQRSELYELLFARDVKLEKWIHEIDEDAQVGKLRQLAETAVRAKRRLGKYDIFLSYSTVDREVVLSIAEELRGLGVRAWLDVWDLVPGKPWQDQLEMAIREIPCAAVLVGAGGRAPWQEREMRAYISRFVSHTAKSVMPVLLPGVKKKPELPTFLSEFQWVDLRKFDKGNREPLRNLVAGILGRIPRDLTGQQLDPTLLRALREEEEEIGKQEKEVTNISLRVNKKIGQLKELDREAIRAQMADQIGVSAADVELVEVRAGSAIVVLKIKDMKGVARLFMMAERGDPHILEFFERCSINPKDFNEDNREVRSGISIGQVHGDVKVEGGVSSDQQDRSVRTAGNIDHAAVSTGDKDRQKVQISEGGDLDIKDELASLRKAVEELDFDAVAKRQVLRDLANAQEEAQSEGPDRSYVDERVAGALERIEKAGKVVSSLTALKTAAFGIATWCAANADKLGPLLERMFH